MRVFRKWENREWRPFFGFRYETLKQKEGITRNAGVPALTELFFNSPVFSALTKALPERYSHRSYHPLQFALTFIIGFWLGYDCLDDLDQIAEDSILSNLLGVTPNSRTLGDYLRSFTPEHIRRLREVLRFQALCSRRLLNKEDKVIFNIDSTDHEHHGDLIEGLEINYKGKWCLDSLEVFDELGFCWDFDLRPGATFSSQGADQMLWDVARSGYHDGVRADSAFCNEEFIRVCLNKKLKGTVTAHGNIGWEEQAQKITNWRAWEYTPEEIERATLTGQSLPKIEVGYYMYAPKWAEGKLEFPVVVKRTFRKFEDLNNKEKAELQKQGVKTHGLWKHYAVLSLMGLHPKTPQQIIEFHNGRSQMENLIREGKINFDLRHFPCKPMRANHAYALLGLIAHNFLRLIALTSNPNHPSYAKKLRRNLVYIEGKLVRCARRLILRVPEAFIQEVNKIREAWQLKPYPAISTA